jgi:alcohol dehydrogenase (cytochrome c)
MTNAAGLVPTSTRPTRIAKKRGMENRERTMKGWRPRLKKALMASAAIGVCAPPAISLGVSTLDGKHIEYYVTEDMLLNADKDPNNWLMYGRDYESTRYSPLKQINTDNVGDLVAKWSLSFGVLGAQDSQITAVNGRLYVSSSQNRVFAIDGITGKVLWRYDRKLPADLGPKLCCGDVNRGVIAYEDKVILATLDTHVVALDNHTGEVVWETKLGDYKTGEIFTSMPVIVDNKVLIGNSGGDVGANPGTIYALNVDDGKEAWKTHTVPMTGKEEIAKTWGGDSWKTAGGTPWLPGSYDKETGLLLWGVGNPVPDFDGSVRPGDNLYTGSTIAVDIKTGAIKGHFQYTPHDVWDYDGTNETILITDKENRKTWLHADRNGHLYSIDRKTYKCNWVVPMGRVNWVKSWGENCRPEADPEKVPTYGKETKDIAPVLDGGKEWVPAAFSKRTGYVYVPGRDMSMDLAAKKQEFKPGQWFLGTDVLRLNPGGGYVKAFDGTTGELVWSRRQNTPATGGMLATAGGVVFNGDAEGAFRAIKDDTGETLWEFNVGTGIHSNPTTFMVGNTQYVAILAGPGGGSIWPLVYGDWLKTRQLGGSLFVFALHKKQ